MGITHIVLKPNDPFLQSAIEMIHAKTKTLGEKYLRGKYGGGFPAYTENGVYQLREYTWWTAGFYTGLNYACYQMTGDDYILRVARETSRALQRTIEGDKQAYWHDIGFTMLGSFWKEYQLTGDETAKNRIIRGGDALMKLKKMPGTLRHGRAEGHTGCLPIP